MTSLNHKVVAVILAAGSSTRMGDVNKLLKVWKGKPLVAHVVDATLAVDNKPGGHGLAGVFVVTGHQADQVGAVVGSGATIIHNSEFKTGMASSLRIGVEQAKRVGAHVAMVLLGDMPLVASRHIEAMLAASLEAPNSIIQATCDGQPGNPVCLPQSLFDEILSVGGDQGARAIIKKHGHLIVPVEIGDAARRDFDTPDAFDAAPDQT